MEVDVNKDGTIRLTKLYNVVELVTEEGNAVDVCMRDDTLEINVKSKDSETSNWWRVNMGSGEIVSMSESYSLTPNLTESKCDFHKGLCGCGKPVRYMISGDFNSCNKYRRCPSYDEIYSELDHYKGLAYRAEIAITELGGLIPNDEKAKAWLEDYNSK